MSKTIYSVELIYDTEAKTSTDTIKVLYTIIAKILNIFNLSFSAQFCAGGTVTFDKITRVDLRNANPIPLFSSRGNTVTAECNNR